MKRTLTALLLASLALFGTAACGEDDQPNTSGDSNPDSFQTQVPAPVPS